MGDVREQACCGRPGPCLTQLIVGTVNAGKASFTGAIASLREMNRRWPGPLRGLITSRSPLESFADLLLAKPGGIKNVLVL